MVWKLKVYKGTLRIHLLTDTIITSGIYLLFLASTATNVRLGWVRREYFLQTKAQLKLKMPPLSRHQTHTIKILWGTQLRSTTCWGTIITCRHFRNRLNLKLLCRHTPFQHDFIKYISYRKIIYNNFFIISSHPN